MRCQIATQANEKSDQGVRVQILIPPQQQEVVAGAEDKPALHQAQPEVVGFLQHTEMTTCTFQILGLDSLCGDCRERLRYHRIVERSDQGGRNERSSRPCGLTGERGYQTCRLRRQSIQNPSLPGRRSGGSFALRQRAIREARRGCNWGGPVNNGASATTARGRERSASASATRAPAS